MEGNIIDLFMWGYQQHVQISFQVYAERLFKKIDLKLNPKVFFIGVLVDNRNDRHPICLEPEDCGFSTKSFENIKSTAEQLEKVDEERNIIHSHPLAQENFNKYITTKSYINAINKILESDSIGKNIIYFVASPTYLEGFNVFTILSLDKKVFESYYSLTKEKWDHLFTICRSFIESTIKIFLKECSIALKNTFNVFPSIERGIDELLREAGTYFMYSISSSGKNLDGLHGLFETCNEIASLKYEGTVGIGKILIANKDHKNIKLTLQLKEPIKLNDYRKVRKFLELSDNSSSIISDSSLIFGLGELQGKYNPNEESLFIISFTNHFTWEVSHDNKCMMVVEYKEPSLPKEKINKEKFYDDFPRLFKGISLEQINDLWKISIGATKQKHGTILVISDNALNEVERLEKQCIPIEPLKLTDKIVQQITSIDGAVLLDKNSICYAIGVILDGLATDKGDSSRGARFNSAIRYYEHFGKNTSLVLVVISEDGMINLIPTLEPQINHSEIINKINDLRELNKFELIEIKKYNQILNWLESKEFYLTENECIEINKLRKELEQKNKKQTDIWIIRNDLKSNQEMNESYYKND